MSERIATWLVSAIGWYAALGALFAVPFVLRGAGRLDPNAREGTWGFKVLIVPGVVTLWPLLAMRWFRGAPSPPVERNAHRDAARARSS